MFEKQLTYDDLDLDDRELYFQMGYGDALPDDGVRRETEEMKRTVREILHPRFGFVVECNGEVDTERKTLSTGGELFNVGRIITSQIKNAEAFALFVATAGVEFENLQRRLEADGDMVKVFVADAMGSVIAEKTADVMERWLQVYINSRGWRHTNRFSPGYCGWHVSEQHKLFGLLPAGEPCGIRLTDSSLMIPIKSVSGVIGLGADVRKLEYTCGLCDYAKCYKRRKPQKEKK